VSNSGTKQTFTDRPQEFAQRLDVREAHQLFHKINALREPRVRALAGIYDTSSTVFTSASPMASGQADYNTGRPALLVSSTSWTADEDFSILLQALDAYETLADDVKNNLPKLVVLITGKGPMKEDFEKQVEQKEKMWKYVRCRTTWLEMEDYPRLLQCADLGVSLHSSSSGLDFPMKIVDMLGAGLKVLALDFAW
jgi:beta-1,4-mannosyltransferase